MFGLTVPKEHQSSVARFCENKGLRFEQSKKNDEIVFSDKKNYDRAFGFLYRLVMQGH